MMTREKAEAVFRHLGVDTDPETVRLAIDDFRKARASFTEEEYPEAEHEHRLEAARALLRTTRPRWVVDSEVSADGTVTGTIILKHPYMGGGHIEVKTTDEGVAVDIWHKDGCSVIASCWAAYEELMDDIDSEPWERSDEDKWEGMER